MPDVTTPPASLRQLIPYLCRHPHLLLIEGGHEVVVEYRSTVVRRTPRSLRLRLTDSAGHKFERAVAGHDRGSEIGLRFREDGFTVTAPGLLFGSDVEYRFEYVGQEG